MFGPSAQRESKPVTKYGNNLVTGNLPTPLPADGDTRHAEGRRGIRLRPVTDKRCYQRVTSLG